MRQRSGTSKRSPETIETMGDRRAIVGHAHRDVIEDQLVPAEAVEQLADDRRVVCGISFGYADHAQKVNSYRTSRASVADTVTYFD